LDKEIAECNGKTPPASSIFRVFCASFVFVLSGLPESQASAQTVWGEDRLRHGLRSRAVDDFNGDGNLDLPGLKWRVMVARVALCERSRLAAPGYGPLLG
jgi:hypothetical protein